MAPGTRNHSTAGAETGRIVGSWRQRPAVIGFRKEGALSHGMHRSTRAPQGLRDHSRGGRGGFARRRRPHSGADRPERRGEDDRAERDSWVDAVSGSAKAAGSPPVLRPPPTPSHPSL